MCRPVKGRPQAHTNHRETETYRYRYRHVGGLHVPLSRARMNDGRIVTLAAPSRRVLRSWLLFCSSPRQRQRPPASPRACGEDRPGPVPQCMGCKRGSLLHTFPAHVPCRARRAPNVENTMRILSNVGLFMRTMESLGRVALFGCTSKTPISPFTPLLPPFCAHLEPDPRSLYSARM